MQRSIKLHGVHIDDKKLWKDIRKLEKRLGERFVVCVCAEGDQATEIRIQSVSAETVNLVRNMTVVNSLETGVEQYLAALGPADEVADIAMLA